MAEEADDLFGPKWFRAVVLIGLFGGAGGNLVALNKTDDRFRGTDFRREIATRDATILESKRDIAALERSHHAHKEHSAKYTQIIDQLVKAWDKHMQGHE